MPPLTQAELDALLTFLPGVRKTGSAAEAAQKPAVAARAAPSAAAPQPAEPTKQASKRRKKEEQQPSATAAPVAQQQQQQQRTAAAAPPPSAAPPPQLNSMFVPPPVLQPITSTLSCPTSLIGRVIGKAGCNLRGIEGFTGARVQVAREGDGERIISVSGLPASVMMACGLLTTCIAQAASGNAPRQAAAGPRTELRVPCEASKVGWVVGPKGATIKAIRALSGARIDVLDEQCETTGRRSGVVLLSGTEAEVAAARSALDGLLGGKDVDASRAYAAELAASAEKLAAWEKEREAPPLLPPPGAAGEAGAAAAPEAEWERRTAKHPDRHDVPFWLHKATGQISWGEAGR